MEPDALHNALSAGAAEICRRPTQTPIFRFGRSPGTWHLAPGAWRLAPGARSPQPGAGSPEPGIYSSSSVKPTLMVTCQCAMAPSSMWPRVSVT